MFNTETRRLSNEPPELPASRSAAGKQAVLPAGALLQPFRRPAPATFQNHQRLELGSAAAGEAAAGGEGEEPEELQVRQEGHQLQQPAHQQEEGQVGLLRVLGLSPAVAARRRPLFQLRESWLKFFFNWTNCLLLFCDMFFQL